MKNIRSLKKWIEDYETSQKLLMNFKVLYDFYKENEATEEEVIAHYKKAKQFHRSFRIPGICFRVKPNRF